ncbi:hypothetical protein F5Y16DRAFT_225313 [Xylariaceae sp. FL0255]|nr:hypothetical protein F5Y16DRAFT_225313 [Xylariaceae sp. FL0255]
MAPVQNTFCVIPDAPSALNNVADSRPARPPMTTKQVKKAYQKANKGPKLSKAEKRKQELFEQDRIRKEFEKERNQARARAARDKKKEKEERERAEKKKKGLPLFNVRPSQDTIARFVRANPVPVPVREDRDHDNDKDKDSSDGTLCSSGDDFSDLPIPRPVIETVDKENIPPPKRAGLWPIPESNTSSIHPDHDDHGNPPCKKRKTQRFEKETEPVVLKHRRPSQKTPSLKETHVPSVQKTPAVANAFESFSTVDLDEESLLDELIRVEDELAEDKTQPNTPEPQPHASPAVETPPSKPAETYLAPHVKVVKEISAPPRLAISPHVQKTTQIPVLPRPGAFHQTRTSMEPPPIPPKFKSPNSVQITSQHRTPKFIKPSIPSNRPIREPQQPYTTTISHFGESNVPPSTQLFMLNHLDDFLPSPSQEAREIFEEPKRIVSIGAGKSPPLTVKKTLISKEPAANQYMRKPIKTQITSEKSRFTKPIIESVKTRGPPQPPVPQFAPPSKPQSFDLSFLSTQDVFLSSQDMKDIEESPVSSSKTTAPLPVTPVAPVKEPIAAVDPPRPSPRQFFASSARDFHYKYLLQRSKTAAWEGPEARRRVQEQIDQFQAKEDERLQQLLADTARSQEQSQPSSGGKQQDANTRPRTSSSPHADSDQPEAQSQLSIPCSPPIPRRSHANSGGQKAATQRPKSSQSKGNRSQQRPAKSSFNAMLEELEKRTTEQDKVKTRLSYPPGSSNDEDRAQAAYGQKRGKELSVIPASQETDYDGGEEWDDDDLLFVT